MVQTQQYWFPTMQNADIVSALGNWGLHCTVEQLNRPTPEFVYVVYTACLANVTGITPESIQEQSEYTLDATQADHVDNLIGPTGRSILVQYLKRFAGAAQISDFGLPDLYIPETERTRNILSAFINFMKFNEQLDPLFSRLRAKSKTAVDKRVATETEYQDSSRKLEVLEAQRRADEPRCEDLKGKNLAHTKQLMDSKEQHAQHMVDLNALKLDRNQARKRLEDLDAQIAVFTDAIDRLRVRIVKSPDRIKRTITTMGSAVNEDKKQISTFEGKVRDLQAKIAAFSTFDNDIRGCVEQLQTIDKEFIQRETAKREVIDLSNLLEKGKVENSELQTRHSRADTLLTNVVDKLDRAKIHAAEKEAHNNQLMSRLKQEYEAMSADRQENNKAVEGMRGQADEIEKRKAAHLKASELELQDLMNGYSKLRELSAIYMKLIAGKVRLEIGIH